ncbi:FadR/GntR family transcriptional regulator [Devosia sp. YIM 151766]|uniref:FadR/GntR family transcriptional regulator n=1 Tax=Devosia sp. YIM 151766 TaxID=3017325 RepID=UPI00255C3135|nr:FadR/GntR family transcriptional regulator [Devosia sp. YIM 151766]WIY52570.1 FadR/GntR family transcriptional regulator [Devosia sp. YIM 151766]
MTQTSSTFDDEPRHRTLFADRVYQLLQTRISNGEYASDQKLPSEKELSDQFDVSRPIIREALERLRQEGMIYSRQGAGSFVRLRSEPRSLGFPPVETIADIQRCYEFRLTIEPEAAFYAAKRRNEAAIESIGKVVDLLSSATDQQRHREDADFAFHMAVAGASNNHYYSSAMQALRSHIAVGMKLHGLALMGPGRGLEKVLEEHRHIYECIRDGDAETARQHMRQHLEGSRNRLFEDRVLDLSL